MSKKKFEDWVANILEEQDEYAYRYIYDAYITVKNNSGSFYYRLVPEPDRNLLMDTLTKEVKLQFDSPEEKTEFTNYLIKRFCSHTGSMEEWHQKRMYWHGEDLNNWE